MKENSVELKELENGKYALTRTVVSTMSGSDLSSELSRVIYERERCIEDLRREKERYDELGVLENELKEAILKTKKDEYVLDDISDII